MNGGPPLDYAIVANHGERKAHISAGTPWRVLDLAGAREITVRLDTAALCGWPIGIGASVLDAWGSSEPCMPCVVVARYRGYTRIPDASTAKSGGAAGA